MPFPLHLEATEEPTHVSGPIHHCEERWMKFFSFHIFLRLFLLFEMEFMASPAARRGSQADKVNKVKTKSIFRIDVRHAACVTIAESTHTHTRCAMEEHDWVINCVYFLIALDLFTNKFRWFDPLMLVLAASTLTMSPVFAIHVGFTFFSSLFQSISNGSSMIPTSSVPSTQIVLAKFVHEHRTYSPITAADSGQCGAMRRVLSGQWMPVGPECVPNTYFTYTIRLWQNKFYRFVWSMRPWESAPTTFCLPLSLTLVFWLFIIYFYLNWTCVCCLFRSSKCYWN